MKRPLKTAALLLVAALGISLLPTLTTQAADLPQPVQPANSRPALDQLKRHMPWFNLRYAALGDSVAAGLGLAPLSDGAEDTACGRSTDAYAYGVSQRINEVFGQASFGLLQMDTDLIACQGARVPDLTGTQQLPGTSVPAQIDTAFAKGTPALVSLTIGANDVRWADFINQCASAANCATPENTATADSYIEGVRQELGTSFSEIKARSRFLLPVVVATGYYNPVSTGCITNTFATEEVAWLQDRITSLNTVLRETTESQNGLVTRFAPVDFTGHDICAADTWLQRPGSDPAPLHPTVRGQEAMAEAVLQAVGL